MESAEASKSLPTSLGATSVMFDSVAAHLYHVSDNVVQVQAPVALAAGSVTRIQVNASGGSSSVVTLPVVQAKHGILTYEAGGIGQAKAINQDGSLNGDGSITGSDKAAAPGSVISVYATGMGPLDPAIAQGTPAPSSPLWTTAAGNCDLYRGGAGAYRCVPGQRHGACVLIAGEPPRLVLSVDGNYSQGGVTVQIR